MSEMTEARDAVLRAAADVEHTSGGVTQFIGRHVPGVTAALDALIAAAREEGRREGEPDIRSYPEALQSLGRALADLLDDDRWNNVEPMLLEVQAAHAAQLVALRAKALLAYRRAKGALCWEHPSRRCEDCEREFDEFIGPLHDAEAALEKVREDAVRKAAPLFVREGRSHWVRTGHAIRDEDAALVAAMVITALKALGAKPKEGA